MATNDVPKKSETESLQHFLERHHQPRVLEISRGNTTSVEVLVAPHGFQLLSLKEHLDKYLPAPERRSGTATLADIDSFLAHVQRYADSDTVVFADTNPSAPKLLAVIDYHRAGADGAPRWGQHRAKYVFPISDEWSAWNAGELERGISQQDFAELIEERIADIADPSQAGTGARSVLESLGCEFASPAKLMELSRGLAVRVNATVREARNLSSGEAQLAYEERHEDERGAPLKVPGAFLLAVPVFKNGPLYQIPVRLRYRVKDGKVTWMLSLYRSERAFDDAIQEAIKTTRDAGLTVLLGSPE